MTLRNQFQPRSLEQLHKDYRNDSDGPFTSRDQLIAAMSDSRYAQDPTYRAKVEARMAKSDRSALGYGVSYHSAPHLGAGTSTYALGPASDEPEGRW